MEFRQRIYLYVFLVLGLSFIALGVLFNEYETLKTPFNGDIIEFKKILIPYLSGLPKPWE